MSKKDLKSALSKSLQAEEQSVHDRFSKADQMLNSTSTRRPEPQKPPSEPRKKIIRDSFTMPEDDYGLIGAVKDRCLSLGIVLNKGEVIRAGLQVLNDLSAAELKKAAAGVERVKTGRPKS